MNSVMKMKIPSLHLLLSYTGHNDESNEEKKSLFGQP